jgi:hypothetical protein
MFLGDVKLMYRYYAENAKQVKVRASYPKILSRPNPNAEFVKSSPNYDLYFNKSGLLIECAQLDKNRRVVFKYNEFNLLEKIQIFRTGGKYIIETTTFYYDDNRRLIQEVISDIGYGDDDSPPQINYDYNGATRTITLPPDLYSKDLGTFTCVHNHLNQIVEEKGIRNEDEIISWARFEYNSQGEKVREISLDIDGNPDGYCEFYYNEKGLETGFKSFNKEGVYTGFYNDRLYQYNEKGDWINHVLTDEFGAPKIIYDRSIEYF